MGSFFQSRLCYFWFYLCILGTDFWIAGRLGNEFYLILLFLFSVFWFTVVGSMGDTIMLISDQRSLINGMYCIAVSRHISLSFNSLVFSAMLFLVFSHLLWAIRRMISSSLRRYHLLYCLFSFRNKRCIVNFGQQLPFDRCL